MMLDWLEIILAAKEKAPRGGWFRILIPIIIVIVYAISGLLKMKQQKKDQQEETDSSPRPGQARPRYKPVEDRRDQPPQRQRPPAPQPRAKNLPYAPQQQRLVRKIQIPELVQAAEQKPIFTQAQRISAPAAGQPKPRPGPVAIKRQPVRKPQPEPKPAPAETVEAKTPFASLAHLTEPQNLRMAIVYSEILGKPVALRDM